MEPPVASASLDPPVEESSPLDGADFVEEVADECTPPARVGVEETGEEAGSQEDGEGDGLAVRGDHSPREARLGRKVKPWR